ncbi:SDR family NAD(P)-dependent oxidoreductase [Mesorhizobium sp. ES1-1]|uniref:SDR family NAD(P)-dependent oxidoreductase n=1 Tax=Mesorhizobium sp. ES1-1 TaxID=2876629 RepID=UPI001CCC32D0|nr:SDR family oxidoreductase [Mesorhizobium sp. ES1-1]MBZ9677890.1 SDR family oxidoreductase [Mesorhizobium sp. ES1-1]
MADQGEFAGQVAVVTGAARGIGFGIASTLARRGASTVLVDVDRAVLEASVDGLAGAGLTVKGVVADVSSLASVKTLATETLAWKGRIDIVCPNAAVFGSASIVDMTEAEWDRLLSINLKGAFLTLQAFMPAMLERAYGRVVITSSVTGTRTAIPNMIHYATTKAGLLGMVRAAALETAGRGITVNAVAPGHVMTEGAASLYDPEFLAATENHIPMGRLATSDEIADAVAFFASRRAGYITGQSLVVDGGLTLREYPAGYPRV